MRKSPKNITIEENNGVVYSNSILKLDHYYYAYLSQEESIHKLDTNLDNYVESSLRKELYGKILPLIKLDLTEFGLSAMQKVPILYHENYQLEWMIFELSSDNEINNLSFSNRNDFYNINDEQLKGSMFFEEEFEELKLEFNGYANSYYHIGKQKSELDGVNSEMKRSTSEEWMMENEIKARKANSYKNFSANFGPIPLFLQTDFIPKSSTDESDYKFVGMFDSSIFGNLIDAYWYIFYNEKESKVVQYMQYT